MIVLDASVLVAHFEPADRWHESAGELLMSLADEDLLANVVTLAEILVGPARIGRAEEALAALDELAVKAVGLDHNAGLRLARLRAETGLKLPGCSVLLTAELVEGGVASYDDALRRAARKRGLEVWA